MEYFMPLGKSRKSSNSGLPRSLKSGNSFSSKKYGYGDQRRKMSRSNLSIYRKDKLNKKYTSLNKIDFA